MFIDCFWDIQDIIYYLEWFSSVIIPFLCIGIGGVVDYVLVNVYVCNVILLNEAIMIVLDHVISHCILHVIMDHVIPCFSGWLSVNQILT